MWCFSASPPAFPGVVELEDVVIPEQIVYYEGQKVTGDSLSKRRFGRPTNPKVRRLAATFPNLAGTMSAEITCKSTQTSSWHAEKRSSLPMRFEPRSIRRTESWDASTWNPTASHAGGAQECILHGYQVSLRFRRRVEKGTATVPPHRPTLRISFEFWLSKRRSHTTQTHSHRLIARGFRGAYTDSIS